jgi:hypothetical protein
MAAHATQVKRHHQPGAIKAYLKKEEERRAAGGGGNFFTIGNGMVGRRDHGCTHCKGKNAHGQEQRAACRRGAFGDNSINK